MALRITGTADASLINLPWSIPLSAWPEERIAALPRGLSRHVVRFVRYGDGVLAIKETDPRIAQREFSMLSELRRLGFIRLERKGRYQLLHLYSKAWDYLGLAPPTGEGVGGPVHKATVRRLAKAFRKRGYEVHLEHAIGESGKRVDLVCFGRDGILGVEVGLSDVHQEMKNLRDDLAANVLDRILFVSCDPGMVRKVRAAARIDPAVSKHMERIRFLYFEEESP